jgi:hypothetical protein
MNTTWYEKRQREMLRGLLEERFRPLPAPAVERLE